LLGRCSTTLAKPLTLLALVIFEIESYFMPGPLGPLLFLFVLPCVAGIKGMHHHTQTWVEMEFQKLFTLATLNP
jgi:hypothetical protein